MSEESKSKVSYADSAGVLGRNAAESALRFDRQLSLATYYGYPETVSYETTTFGLLAEDERVETPGFWRPRRKRPHVATIQVQGPPDANRTRWLLKVFGRAYIERMTRLANHLAETFSVEVHMRLESEEPKAEITHRYSDGA